MRETYTAIPESAAVESFSFDEDVLEGGAWRLVATVRTESGIETWASSDSVDWAEVV